MHVKDELSWFARVHLDQQWQRVFFPFRYLRIRSEINKSPETRQRYEEVFRAERTAWRLDVERQELLS